MLPTPIPLPDEEILEVTRTAAALAACAPATVLLAGDGLGQRLCVQPHHGAFTERDLGETLERHEVLQLCPTCALAGDRRPRDPAYALLRVAGLLNRVRHQFARVEDEEDDLLAFGDFTGLADELADPVAGRRGELADFLATPDDAWQPFGEVARDLRERVSKFYAQWDAYRAGGPITRRIARTRRHSPAPATVWLVAAAGHSYVTPPTREWDCEAFAAWLLEATPLATTGRAGVFETTAHHIPRRHDRRYPVVEPIAGATKLQLEAALTAWERDHDLPFAELIERCVAGSG